MVLLVLPYPDILKPQDNSTIPPDRLINITDLPQFDSSKLALPLVIVMIQCFVLAFICYKNIQEVAEQERMEETQQNLLNQSLLSGLNLLEVGLSYGTFDKEAAGSSALKSS